MELEFRDGEVTLGMMGGSMKLLDVRRDPRVAVHSATVEPPPTTTLRTGRATRSSPACSWRYPSRRTTPCGRRFFRIDVREVVLTHVGDPADHLVVESWHPGTGVRLRKRY
jgi:hypothetical protein